MMNNGQENILMAVITKSKVKISLKKKIIKFLLYFKKKFQRRKQSHIVDPM